MKKKSAIIIAIILMSIGFAAISTTLILNGNAKVSENNEDFSVIFTAASIDGKDVYSTAVDETKKIITFTTSELKTLNQTSILAYEVTNNSNQYDAEVNVTCVPRKGTTAKYTSIKNKLENDATKVLAKESLNGTLTITLYRLPTKEVTEEYTCTLEVNAIERDKAGYVGSTKWTYDYTGGEQTFTAPIGGKYKIEIWGAQGGSSSNNSTYGGYNGSQAIGGYGGYSEGMVTLSKNQKLNIVVGGGGTSSGMNEFSVAKGGYNGGGNGGKGNTSFYSIGCYSGAGGGGATHVAFAAGILSGFKDNLSELLIVAGGGGGAINHNIENNNGGSAGGIYGNAGSFLKITTCNTNLPKISGGTQNSGYLFGMGQAGRDAVNVSCGQSGAAGGGGGFYGGMSQTENYDTSTGGGGSGYISNTLLTEKSMYCYNCTESSEESTKTVSTTCVNSTPTENCAKQGNGYARITLIN